MGFNETLKYLVRLHQRRQLNFKTFILLLISICPDYYSWWIYFNAFNDSFYSQLLHQFIFSSTELSSTIALLLLCNKDAKNWKNKCFIIYFVAIFHILCASADQFFVNVIFGNGQSHQQGRDIMLMFGDVINLAYSLTMLRSSINSNDSPSTMRITIVLLFGFAIVLTVIVKNL